MKHVQKLLCFVLLSLYVPLPKALACSSCGSGGADPVILTPSESRKLYLGLGVQAGFVDIDSRGETRKSSGPDQKWLAEIAYSQRLFSRLFGSLVADFGLNSKGAQHESGVGDVSLNLRSTLVQPTMIEPEIPQVQLIASRRFGLGRSVNDSQKEHYLDVFGAGNDEVFLGVDTWWGMFPVLFGFSYLHGIPEAEELSDGPLLQGKLHRGIVTAGYLVQPELKLIGGVVADQRGPSTLDDVEQAQSTRRSQNLFLTLESLHPEADNFRLTLTRRGAFGEQQNAAEAYGLTLAWMSLL